MPKNNARAGRVGDLLHRELAKLIQEEMTDNSLGMITVSGVEVTDDLAFARVYVSVLPDDREAVCMSALDQAVNGFRSQMAKTLKLRIMPKIKFYYDPSLRTGTRMDQLLNSVKDPNHDQ